MKLERFIYHLHFETEKIYPSNWEVNWEDAPLVYKLYRNLPELPLTGEVPLTLGKWEKSVQPSLETIGHFLWYVYGLTQYSQSTIPVGTGEHEHDVSISQTFRRFVPSGGALYPNELYVYLKIKDIPEGIYHYSVAHHHLVSLREGNFDSFIARSMGDGCVLSNCFCTVFISTVVWKNFYKYNNFSYRLQGLDAGVLMGQTLETAEQMGFTAKVCYQFIDRSVNYLLGLAEEEESVYAIIPLSLNESIEPALSSRESVTAADLCSELDSVSHETLQRSKTILEYPMIVKMNESSKAESTDSFRKLVKDDNNRREALGMGTIMLPFNEPLTYNFSSVCRQRYSPDLDFTLQSVNETQLSKMLKQIFSFAYHQDLDDSKESIKSRYRIYGCFYQVKGIPDGAYYYDPRHHLLQRISSGDFREYLQYGLTMDNVNLFQVPICFHIVGDREHLVPNLGYRGYRIQQMEAGILVQRLLLAAGAQGLAGHPLLGFDCKSCDELYNLEAKGKTSLIQIPVGHTRPRAWLKGAIHS